MLLAFYKWANSQRYGRDTFDDIANKRDVIISMLGRLQDDELLVYNLNDKFDKRDFVEDYNDKCLNGGYWCVEIPD